jgi:hypothetical protein
VTLASFLSSGTQHAILNGLAFFAFVLWLSLGYWTYKDARRRIEDPLLIGLATLLGLGIPFVGPFIYMLFRPPEYLEDVRERELEIKAMEERLSRRDMHCPVCRADVDPAFLICPVCTTRLRQSCRNCKAPLEALWQICPYCETPVEPAVTELDQPTLAPPRPRRS